jgi:Right handed beta helix region
MKMSRRAALVATTVLTTVAMTPLVAAAQQGTTLTVQPGQSIQDALNAARPGDTVLVLAGEYREQLEITTDRITLQGRGAVLRPPQTPVPRRCSQNFGLPENPYGICVSGLRDPDTGAVARPVEGVTVAGFTVGEFPDSGIIGWGTTGMTIRDSNIAGGPGDSGYSILMLRSTTTTIVRNTVHGAGGAGVYIGSSPDARAYVAYNIAYQSGSLGFMFRDSFGGLVEYNISYDNCMGMGFVDGLSAGTARTWTARNNVIRHNNLVCPGEPVVSGVGILLAGAHDITLERNVIVDNQPASATAVYGGGVVLASGSVFGGTEVATGNHVRNNIVLGNAPADLNLVETGPGNELTGNVCRTSVPAGLC